eukprot:CAMPEP_0116068084 /NCGR_PEP_ID=MMETSP0322-20121206/11445_1 /TAXON_ID=163516 /ORGANISM="Leptocylindrus danicus var. apora, Strain B651" /LENGTH=409 /DNA_ID=CAMNT_0003555117 /DNA_START=61 /DNA_END=1290 /DNA_ORIENTATION=-
MTVEGKENVTRDIVITGVALLLQGLTSYYFSSKYCESSSLSNDGSVDAALSKSMEPDPSTPFESFGFGLNVEVDFMWIDQINEGAGSAAYSSEPRLCLKPMGEIRLHPAATVLNYGQSLFEGMKAFRRIDGSIALFRPERNASRMKSGAARLLIPPIPEKVFVKACNDLVRANAKWVPPYGKGALYLRPLLFGSGAALGVKPSTQYTFCIYCSPVGDYFKKGSDPKPIRLQAIEDYSRAAPGGVGSVKAAGNYAPCFKVQKEVKERGYDEALFLSVLGNGVIEEAGASNFFAVFPDNSIVTPSLGTILPGITRESVIELARNIFGCTVYERQLTLDDLKDASEAFCCGTGASITAVGSVNIASTEESIIFGEDGTTMGPLTKSIKESLLAIQMGTNAENNYSNWIHRIE